MFVVDHIYVAKIFVAVTIFFCWVVRYQNVVEEFEAYKLPAWLRDLMGILMIAFAAMIFSDRPNVVIFGSGGIVVFMIAELINHARVDSGVVKVLSSLSLLFLSILVFGNIALRGLAD